MRTKSIDEDKAAEYIMRQIDSLRLYAAEIGEDDVVEKLEEAFNGILGRYHARKIERLNLDLNLGLNPQHR